MKRTRILALAAAVALAACSQKKSFKSEPADGDDVAHFVVPTPASTRVASATPAPTSIAVATPPVVPGLDGMNVVNGKPYADMFFRHFGVNPTIDTEEEPVSTFSVDVDTASYSVARSYLNRGHLPEEDAVRVEEFVNSFDYEYATPEEDAFSVQMEAFPSPNRHGYHVLHVGLKGKDVEKGERKPSNLVFVIDVSGSMAMETRLELVKRALRLLVNELDERDTVGIVVFGSSARDVLEPTSATKKEEILAAIDGLRTEGATNVQAGLKRGYKMVSKGFLRGGVNRVILCGDGVANNGITNADRIFETVREEAKDGITISTVGFGMGNYNDVLMERLAQVGDGNYSYVDTLDAARKIFVEQLTGTLQVIAKDVKIQLELDPKRVTRYRLLGFENRMLEKEEFDDDAVDAGEIGAGHTVTAMYEVKFAGASVPKDGSFATLRIRHKLPEGGRSAKIEKQVPFAVVRGEYAKASAPTKLSFVAAGFAEKLRGSYWVRNLDWAELVRLHEELPGSLRSRKDVAELGDLIRRARSLDSRGDKFEKYGTVAEMDFDRIPVLE